MGLTRSPEAELEPHRLGTIATGPWAVGTVVGSVIGGHRGRREATEIPTNVNVSRVGRGLKNHPLRLSEERPSRLLYYEPPYTCWYNRLLFSYIEHRAALQGLTRAAMAVAPPWGVVLLRSGPPGPMPTF
jgi:hypothetical protein